MGRLIIDGNRVYELDEVCMKRKKQQVKAEKNQKEEQTERLRAKKKRF